MLDFIILVRNRGLIPHINVFYYVKIWSAIVSAAAKVCARPESAGKMVVCVIPSFGERYFTHPMFSEIKEKAENLTKQPLPPPFDNREYGFNTERG